MRFGGVGVVMLKPRISRLAMGTSLAIALLGLSGCDQLRNRQTSSPSPSPTTTVESETQTPETSPTGTDPGTTDPVTKPPSVKRDQPEVYWLTTTENKVALAPSPLTTEPGQKTAEQRLTAAMDRLIKGPANADVTTTIPSETKVNSLKVKPDGVHVDLNKAFTSGGGSTAMQGRLGQVLYTASSLDPDTPIWISVDGEPLKVLGGEGLELSQPMTRQEFDKNFSL
jgi:spore germination protein GerM